ncbi:S-layer homology domain-containing protein [Oscillibacter sp.]|uniref:S-layer homology domain-containing protein n=1 Tax=Oscillibacter sp. TaxID=1945593 RepID=UPI003394E594
MREFWEKRLPALLLTALMLAGTVIPAIADPASGDGSGSSSSTTDPPATVHHFSPNWSSDATNHWHACTDEGCTEKNDVASHVCTAGWKDKKDGIHHQKVCDVCGQEMECEEHHMPSAPTSTIPATCASTGKNIYECMDHCGYQKEEIIPALPHTPSDAWTYDTTSHWHICSVCKQEISGTRAAHTYDSSYTTDASYHWRICTVCKGTSAKEAHVDKNNDGVCDICGRGGLPISAKCTVTFINSGSTFASQSNINKGACPTNPGTPAKNASNCSYSFRGWTTSDPGTTAVYTGQTIYSSAQIAVIGVSTNVVYYAVYSMTASNQNASVDVAETAEVTVGTVVRDKLNSLVASVAGRSFTTVTFTTVSNSYYGILYANSGKASLTGRTYSYSGGSYPITDLYFVPSGTRGTYSVTYSASDGYSTIQGTLSINTTDTASTKITYTVRPGQKVSLASSDFNGVYQTAYSDTVRWVEFTSVGSFSTSDGAFYYNYGKSNQQEFSRTSVDDYTYYYSSSGYGTYPIDDLSFVAAGSAAKKTISVNFRAYYSNSRYVDGTMEIQISGTASAITYQVSQGEEVNFDRSDFNRVFQDSYSGYDLRYVSFLSSSSYDTSCGTFYYDCGGRNERAFTKSNLTSYAYYYNSSSYGDYALDDLSFVASSSFTGSTTLTFRAYYDSNRYVDGSLVIQAKEAVNRGDVRYYTTGSTNVQINPNDITRFLNKAYSGSVLQSVKLGGVPQTGTLYYNYYGVSSYGASNLRLTSSNCDDHLLYFSPTGTSQYALSELTYVPSGTNYCVTIPFTAYSTNNRSAQGNILISVNSVTVQDVYGATPMNTSVTFPSSAIYSAVAAAVSSNASLYSIQLLELPASSKGTIYVGTGSTKANTNTRYTYSASSGSGRISDLRFVPATGFTGSVEIPYVAYNSSDRAIASGRLCLGIVGSLKSYRDVTTSVWCYKYVAELSDGKVIDGYPDGYFRPDKTVTYGQALKLIMLASNYRTQAPTGKHPFSGYLSRAKADGLLTGVKDSDLDRPISRLAVAQITAKAMRLGLSNLSSVKPFTDTSDVYVQALSAAGIVEGYFSSGTSTFKPSSTMTRGQISAIVWRMERAE